jgi:hypothetical protein
MEYRNSLIESLQVLSTIRDMAFTQLVNLSLANELLEINDAFDVGDGFSFELSQFEGLTDTNVQKLLELCKSIEKTYFEIADLNRINEKEVEDYEA